MSEVVAELTRRAEKCEEEAARSERYQASHSYLDPLDDEATSANTAAAKAYREAAELVRQMAPARTSAHEIILRNENGY